MSSYRRLTLQLTPLLDLLLIVIFGQYLHVLHERVGETQASQEAVERAEELEEKLAGSLEETKRAVQRAHDAEARLNEQLFALEQAQEDLDRTMNQQRVAGELMVQLFQLPPMRSPAPSTPPAGPALPLHRRNSPDWNGNSARWPSSSPGG